MQSSPLPQQQNRVLDQYSADNEPANMLLPKLTPEELEHTRVRFANRCPLCNFGGVDAVGKIRHLIYHLGKKSELTYIQRIWQLTEVDFNLMEVELRQLQELFADDCPVNTVCDFSSGDRAAKVEHLAAHSDREIDYMIHIWQLTDVDAKLFEPGKQNKNSYLATLFQ